MEKNHYDWICSETTSWVEQGIITEEQAERILTYYQQPPKEPLVQLNTLVGALGAIFVGLGVILLLAYNWDDLSRPARLGIAIGLLVCSQAGTCYNETRRTAGRYREAWAALQSLMVGAAIGLMGQTYHMDLQFDRFLLVWMALILPLAYLTNTALPVVIYGILGIVWAEMVRDTFFIWSGWLMLAAMFPLWRQWRGKLVRQRLLVWCMAAYLIFYQISWSSHFYGKIEIWLLWVLFFCLLFLRARLVNSEMARNFLAWFVALDAVFVFIVTCESYFALFTPQVLAVFFICMFAWGRWLEVREKDIWRRPLTLLGVSLSWIVCFFLSFRYGWYGWGQSYAQVMYLIGGLAALAAFGLWRANLRTRLSLPERFHACLVPLLVAAILLESQLVSIWLVNAYLFLWGLLLFKRGVDICNAGCLNGGLGIVSALIVARFFDTHISFLVRGLVYIALGCGFIALNFWIRKRKGARGNED